MNDSKQQKCDTLMKRLYLEQEPIETCEHARPFTRVPSYIYLENDIGIYDVIGVSFVEWRDCSPEVFVDIILGDLSVEDLTHRFLVSAIYSREGDPPFTIIDAANRMQLVDYGALTCYSMSKDEYSASKYRELIDAVLNLVLLKETRAPWTRDDAE